MPATEPNSHNGPSPRPASEEATSRVCPYCGHVQPGDAGQCESCQGLFEPLSKQATQNAMGAWFIRDGENPFLPGCSYQTLEKLVKKGRISPETVVRGPTTRQFWAFAKDTPGLAHLLGACHNCHAPAEPDEYMCAACGAVFVAPSDRQSLGLAPIRLLPGQTPAGAIASAALSPKAPALAPPPVAPTPAQPPARPPSPAPALLPPTPAPRITAQSKTLRRLRSQIANLKALAALLIAVNVVLLIGVGAMVVRQSGAPAPAEAERPAPAAPTASPTDQPADPAKTTAAEPTGPETDGATPMLSAVDLETKDALQQQFMDALEQAETGDLADLEAAAATLKRIRDDNPARLHPAGLDEALADLNRRIDEAYVRKFID